MEATTIQDWVRQRIATLLEVQVDEIDAETPLERFGLGSRDTTEIVSELQSWLKIELPATLVYEHENIQALASAVAQTCEARQ
jgi:acyl carrier protein